MEFLHRVNEIRVRGLFLTLTIWWLPNIFRVNCRNIDIYDKFKNQLNTYSTRTPNSFDNKVDHFMSEYMKDLLNRQAKLDNDAGVGEAKIKTYFEGPNYVAGLLNTFKRRQDSFHSKASRDFNQDDETYFALKNNIIVNGLENSNPVKARRNYTAEQTFDDLMNPETNTSEKMQMKNKRGLDPDSCETENTDLELEFTEHVSTDSSSYVLTCKGTVTVKKCEGLCNSSVSPSVNHYDGFQRECTCCKEGHKTQRPVTLSDCTINSEIVFGHYITRTVAEPSNCSCQECRN